MQATQINVNKDSDNSMGISHDPNFQIRSNFPSIRTFTYAGKKTYGDMRYDEQNMQIHILAKHFLSI